MHLAVMLSDENERLLSRFVVVSEGMHHHSSTSRKSGLDQIRNYPQSPWFIIMFRIWVAFFWTI